MASQNYPFPNSFPTFFTDFGINNQNPGFGFGGTESGAVYFEQREINGTLYQVQNATWNKVAQKWLLIDPTKPAYALALVNGAYSQLSSPAGTTPFTSWQTQASVVGSPVNAGIKTLVPADASASSAVTLTPGFSTATLGVLISVGANYTGTDNAALTVRLAASPTKTGFSVLVAGGQAGTTVDVHYLAWGS